jgi:hypothetical protein
VFVDGEKDGRSGTKCLLYVYLALWILILFPQFLVKV